MTEVEKLKQLSIDDLIAIKDRIEANKSIVDSLIEEHTEFECFCCDKLVIEKELPSDWTWTEFNDRIHYICPLCRKEFNNRFCKGGLCTKI